MQAVSLGLTGNEISKKITGTSAVTRDRSLVATGSGALLGAVATETVVIGASAIGCGAFAAAAAPIVVPLALVSGFVSFLASRFD
jgi:hypothetical protein